MIRTVLVFTLFWSLLPMLHATTVPLPERVVWDDQAIPLHIPVGQERTVHFPDGIRYWLPDHLASKLTALSANGVLYLQAHQPFTPTRLRIQSLTTQQLYLLDVHASEDSGTTAKLIVLDPEQVVNESTNAPMRPKRDWYERLTRYAAQQLYAPARLITGDPGIRRIAIDADNVQHLLRDPRIAVNVIASWTGGGLFVTALRLENQSDQALALALPDGPTSGLPPSSTINLPHTLRGRWLTASVQHAMLEAASSPNAVTTLFLLSDRPFLASLERTDGY